MYVCVCFVHVCVHTCTLCTYMSVHCVTYTHKHIYAHACASNSHTHMHTRNAIVVVRAYQHQEHTLTPHTDQVAIHVPHLYTFRQFVVICFLFYNLMRVSVISPMPVRAYCDRLFSTIAYKPSCGIIAVFAHTATGSLAPLLIRQCAKSFLYLRHALQTTGGKGGR